MWHILWKSQLHVGKHRDWSLPEYNMSIKVTWFKWVYFSWRNLVGEWFWCLHQWVPWTGSLHCSLNINVFIFCCSLAEYDSFWQLRRQIIVINHARWTDVNVIQWSPHDWFTELPASELVTVEFKVIYPVCHFSRVGYEQCQEKQRLAEFLQTCHREHLAQTPSWLLC